jgi:hypothetical protein
MRPGSEVQEMISFQSYLDIQLSERCQRRRIPLEQVRTWPNDAAIVVDIFGTPLSEKLSGFFFLDVFIILKSSSI